MAINSNGYIAVDKSEIRTKRESMERFDSFSPEIRAILRDAHYNVSLTPGCERMYDKQTFWLKETLRYIAKKSALKTYGSNYPLDII